MVIVVCLTLTVVVFVYLLNKKSADKPYFWLFMMAELWMVGNHWYTLLSCTVMFWLHIKTIREREKTIYKDRAFLELYVSWIGVWLWSMLRSIPFWSFQPGTALAVCCMFLLFVHYG